MKNQLAERLLLDLPGMKLESVNPGFKTFILVFMIMVFLGVVVYFLQAWVLPALAMPKGKELINNCIRIFEKKETAPGK